MKSNYKRLGPYIRQVDIRNKDDKRDNLLGVSVTKEFIKSIANTVGTDFTKYKVVKKNQFTYIPDTSRRGDKIAIALLENEDEGLVSQAYTVFEISDIDSLLPEYLIMWFRRPEFDRYARFISHGSVREIFSWEDMCDVELPIPSIQEQIEIVNQYNAIRNKLKLNNQIIKKLEETASIIYKKWFIDFEFPNLEGKPYKSSGGEMKFCEEMNKEIPKDWSIRRLDELTEQICVGFVGSVYNYYCDEQEGIPMLRTTDITEDGLSYKNLRYVTKDFHHKNKKSQLKRGDLLVARHGTNGLPVIFDADFEANCLNAIIVKPNPQKMSSKLIHCFLTSKSALEHIQTSLGGSVQDVLNTQKIADLELAYPDDFNSIPFNLEYLDQIQKFIEYKRRLKQFLEKLLEMVLAKISRVVG